MPFDVKQLKYPQSIDESWAAEVLRKGFGSDAEARQEISTRLDELEVMKADNGGSLAGLPSEQTERVKRLLSEVEVLRHAPVGRPGMPGGGGLGGVAPAKAAGWKAGHWGSPFMRAVKELTPSGSVTVPSLTGGIVPIEDRPRRLLDVIPRLQLQGTDQFSYLRETVRTHAAAAVAPGGRKPTSTYSVERVDDRARVIAHLTEPIPRQTLADAELLTTYVDQSLRVGVQLEVDDQVLNGDGVGENLTGLANTSGVQVVAFDTDILTTSRRALTALEDEEIVGGVYVLSSAMWETLELSFDANQNYYLGGPVDRAARRLWGQPAIVTSALTGTDAFLVDFQGSTRLWEREAVRVDWSENVYDPDALGAGVGASDFERNLLRFRGEGRFGFGVTRPAGVVRFATVAPGP